MQSIQLKIKELLRERGWTIRVLSEKTGISESYLTHIKNGTRRWNEDTLKKISQAFNLHPLDLFSNGKNLENKEKMLFTNELLSELKITLVPVLNEIPSNPSYENNRKLQIESGLKSKFVPVANISDPNIFGLLVQNNQWASKFSKGDFLIISTNKKVKSGDIVAVEYKLAGAADNRKTIAQVSYLEDFIVLEFLNNKLSPIALVKDKDHFRIIGKVIYRYQPI